MTLTDTRATDTDESTPAAEEGSSAAPEKKSPRERFKNFGDPNAVARFAGRALALIHGGGKNDRCTLSSFSVKGDVGHSGAVKFLSSASDRRSTTSSVSSSRLSVHRSRHGPPDRW